MKVKKERFANLLEYGFLIERASIVLLIVSSVVLAIIIPAWPVTIANYFENPNIAGQYSLGLSILATTLMLLSSIAAFLIPYFTPLLKTRSSKELRDVRTRNLYLLVTATLLSVTILVYLLAALTTV